MDPTSRHPHWCCTRGLFFSRLELVASGRRHLSSWSRPSGCRETGPGSCRGTGRHPFERPPGYLCFCFHLGEFFARAMQEHHRLEAAGVDAVANFAKLWAELFLRARRSPKLAFSVTLSNGKILSGKLHEVFRNDLRLEGKCVDLESANRQLAIAPSQRRLSVITVKNPKTGRPSSAP